ncbi:hypothetical protein TWF481_000282 [Arthrobotrys musiformis]|uniref:Uncharacterized protein n=1 Tax=Arthrobotrys musiformis TaxID=47236 RepID=A0AAV9WM58_9PEZI
MLPNTDQFQVYEPAYSASRYCLTEIDVERCKFWYNCHCSLQMKEPKLNPEIPVQEYQDALNNVPSSVKRRYPNALWQIFGNDMTWQYTGDYPPASWFEHGPSAPGPSDSYSESIPGINEPYYLQGPDGDLGPYRSVPNNAMFGVSNNFWSGSSMSLRKRDISKEIRTTDQKEES